MATVIPTPTASSGPSTAREALASLWAQAGLPAAALAQVALEGADPVFPSSFAVGAAAQSTVAAAALAACELGHARDLPRHAIAVDMLHAAVEATGWFSLDGRQPEVWDRFSGLYHCADGQVRLHTNFKHHRDGALRLLGLAPDRATREQAQAALRGWRAVDFETAASAHGLVATALRSFAAWDATPQGRAVARQPLYRIDRIGDAADSVPPLALPPLRADQRPLTGVRVLELTRILAGPVGGRTLAAHGADVMLINSPHLPNIDAIADTSRGKRSACIDLKTAEGTQQLGQLVDDTHVFVQGYRPGAIAALGFSPEALARRRPGIVCVSLSAYGKDGPCSSRRGFDSLLQTAMGFNQAEGEAAASAFDGAMQPRVLPMQILDEATGFLIAFGAAAALWRQQCEGGSWHVQVSLAQTGHWLRGLGRVAHGLTQPKPDERDFLESTRSGFGELLAVRHSARLARTPATWLRPSMPPGSHAPAWR